jgi:hypothetical protein
MLPLLSKKLELPQSPTMPSSRPSSSSGTERSSKESFRDSIFSDKDDESESTEDEKSPLRSSPSQNDVEAQPTLGLSIPSPPATALEYRIPASRKLAYLALYFLLNLSLTIYNKAVLGSVSYSQPACLVDMC